MEWPGLAVFRLQAGMVLFEGLCTSQMLLWDEAKARTQQTQPFKSFLLWPSEIHLIHLQGNMTPHSTSSLAAARPGLAVPAST